ncbi:MAG: heptaprenyl diphosphate synthase [Spirochaetaceae bacterium]|nr:MAG: heptaprenyl diphosphate synthase [Spirochaetaceae bacterium]
MTRKAIDSERLVAFLAGFALFLATIEYAIPKPLPFLRLGIANLPILIALRRLPLKDLLVLVGIKLLVQGFYSGTLFSYIFVLSACGGIASGAIMVLAALLPPGKVSLAGCSLLGAFASNAVQLAVAGFFIFGQGVFVIAPPFLLLGTISSFLLGFFAEQFVQKSAWVSKHLPLKN